jgi:hypothetical protein
MSVGRSTSRMAGSIQKKRAFEQSEWLGCMVWKNAVKAALYDHTKATLHSNPQASLTAAMTMLRKYEYLEPFALLELAVWKAGCLKQMPSLNHDICPLSCPSINHDIYRAQQWIASSWKAHKAEQRYSNAMSIIVSLVRPFLDPWRCLEDSDRRPVKAAKLPALA